MGGQDRRAEIATEFLVRVCRGEGVVLLDVGRAFRSLFRSLTVLGLIFIRRLLFLQEAFVCLENGSRFIADHQLGNVVSEFLKRHVFLHLVRK